MPGGQFWSILVGKQIASPGRHLEKVADLGACLVGILVGRQIATPGCHPEKVADLGACLLDTSGG